MSFVEKTYRDDIFMSTVRGSPSPLKFEEDHFSATSGDHHAAFHQITSDTSHHRVPRGNELTIADSDPLSTSHNSMISSVFDAIRYFTPRPSSPAKFVASSKSPDRWQVRAGHFSPFKNDSEDEHSSDNGHDEVDGQVPIPRSKLESPRPPCVTSRSAFSMPLFGRQPSMEVELKDLNGRSKAATFSGYSTNGTEITGRRDDDEVDSFKRKLVLWS